MLRRLVEDGRETYQLERPIGYWDASVGALFVPANLARFRTDLASVPRLFTWLVPKTGSHLPAALLHDGLVHKPSEPQSYVAARQVDRTTADRVFRDAMRDLGTPWLRRWLVWTAVTLATMTAAPAVRTWRALLSTWWSRVLVALTILLVVAGGTASTIDLLDWRVLVPWMGDRATWVELVTGAAAAVIPLVLSVLWWRRWVAGVFTGVALALLLHVTVAIVVVFAVFSAIQAAAERWFISAVDWLLVAAAVVAAIVAVGVWAHP